MSAASGNVAVITTLFKQEVQALTDDQVKAVRSTIMHLDLLGRQLVSAVCSGKLDIMSLSYKQLDALAWRLHVQPDILSSFVSSWLRKVTDLYEHHVSSRAAEAAAVEDLAVAFELEKEVARLNTIAQPKLLMSGRGWLQASSELQLVMVLLVLSSAVHTTDPNVIRPASVASHWYSLSNLKSCNDDIPADRGQVKQQRAFRSCSSLCVIVSPC